MTMPDVIYAWWFLEGKRDDVMKGGWDDKPDRGTEDFIRASISNQLAQAAESYLSVLNDPLCTATAHGIARFNLSEAISRHKAATSKNEGITK